MAPFVPLLNCCSFDCAIPQSCICRPSMCEKRPLAREDQKLENSYNAGTACVIEKTTTTTRKLEEKLNPWATPQEAQEEAREEIQKVQEVRKVQEIQATQGAQEAQEIQSIQEVQAVPKKKKNRMLRIFGVSFFERDWPHILRSAFHLRQMQTPKSNPKLLQTSSWPCDADSDADEIKSLSPKHTLWFDNHPQKEMQYLIDARKRLSETEKVWTSWNIPEGTEMCEDARRCLLRDKVLGKEARREESRKARREMGMVDGKEDEGKEGKKEKEKRKEEEKRKRKGGLSKRKVVKFLLEDAPE